MSTQIKLDDCPGILKDAVNDELVKAREYDSSAKIISCVANNPLNGSSVTYKAYIFNLNTFTILTYISNPRYYDIGVMKDLVTIGEIREIIQMVPEYFK